MAYEKNRPIPGPRPLPILGNLLDLDRENTIQSWVDLAGTYGPIYKLRLGGADRLFVTGYDLVNELCSRKDFVKVPVGLVRSQKQLTPEGLFTADHGEEFWELAHRILVPAFGPLSVRNMFAEMHDIISQMIMKWARFGPGTRIDASSDFTRLTLDTIALCAMDIRFNSFYKEDVHPFVKAMNETFAESQQRSIRPGWLSALMWGANQRFDANHELLHKTAAEVIAARRKQLSPKNDLVNAMINGQDTVTGQTLSDQSIMDNMITFLIAGHETTSGLLGFVFALLMLNPDKYKKLQKEIDKVLGKGPMAPEHLTLLPYTKACLREALRLHPPAAGFSLSPIGNTPLVLGGEWLIRPDDCCVILLPKLHRDPAIFGADADVFRPERMLDENFRKLPPNCFKPFGNGARACIGSEFAMQEAIMATAMLVQKFDFAFVDPDWKMSIRQMATLRPRNLSIYAKLRDGIDPLSLQGDLYHHPTGLTSTTIQVSEQLKSSMLILFGSNTGTCQGLAELLSRMAAQRGYHCAVKSLNDGVGLATRNPLIIISSSHYEGQPPDNAKKFIEWLERDNASLSGIKFAVFGCGNTEWSDTYQAIPTLIETRLKLRGAHIIAPRGAADAAEGNIVADFERWAADHMWPGINRSQGQSLESGMLHPSSEIVSRSIFRATVKDVEPLTSGEPRPKYQIELELPHGITYEVGDYLEVYPENSVRDIKMLDEWVRANKVDPNIPLFSVLKSRNELNQPISVRQLGELQKLCPDDKHREIMTEIGKSVASQSLRRPSVLRVLRACPSVSITPEQLALMLPPLRPRLYSISSSPLTAQSRCTLTWSLLSRDVIKMDDLDTQSPGLASHYLSELKSGETLQCSVRSGHSQFRPPDLTTPIVMICAGAGIAPFSGFIQHRTEQVKSSPGLKETVGPAILYVGCRSPDTVPLTFDESVDVRYAFSRSSGSGFRGHVQERVWADREELVRLWDRGAKVYVCGSRDLSSGIKDVVRRIYMEYAPTRCGRRTETDLDAWWFGILNRRLAVDVL